MMLCPLAMYTNKEIMETNFSNSLVCVNEDDVQLCVKEKMEVHLLGLLHRAFSIFIFKKISDFNHHLLIQKRSYSKYHTPGLWTNTCCGHASPVKDIQSSAKIRLKEEMGFNCELKPIGKFIYKSILDNGLIEHEIDHVFIGFVEKINISPNPVEVDSYRWTAIENILQEYQKNPSLFTPWFYPSLQLVINNLKEAHDYNA